MDKKFIDYVDIDDYEILTDTGFVDIVGNHKTIQYEIWSLKTTNFGIDCAVTPQSLPFTSSFMRKYETCLDFSSGSIV